MADDPIPGMDLPPVEGELQDVAGIGRQARQLMSVNAPEGTHAAPTVGAPMPPSAAAEDAKIYGIKPAPPEKIGFFDALRMRGATEDQIGKWVAKHREDWRALGYSDQQIDATVTGSKTLNPRHLPAAFMDRAAAAQQSYDIGAAAAASAGVDVGPAAVGGLAWRLGGAVAEGAAAGFGEEPLGVPEEDMARLRAVRRNGLATRAVDEVLVQAAYSTVQGLFRGIQAGLMGIGAGAGQVAAEVTGGNEAEQARARRDFAQLANIAAILAGSEVSRGPGEIVGRAPASQDFSNASRTLTPGRFYSGTTRATLMKTWDDYGIHPAEVVNDAQQDPRIAKQIVEGQVPDRYTGKTARPPPTPPPRPSPGLDPLVGVYTRPDGRTIGVMQSMDGNYIIRDINSETRGLPAAGVEKFLRDNEATRLDRVNQRPPPSRPVPTETVEPPKPEERIRVFHGSPHEFEEFDNTKIGTGEGAQAFGHGLYFAEHPDVAQEYRERLAQGKDEGVRAARSELNQTLLKKIKGAATEEDVAKAAEKVRAAEEKVPGNIYEAEILAHPDEFLHLDKPLEEQSAFVQEAIRRAGITQVEPELGNFMGQPIRGAPQWAPTAEQAAALREAGVKGIKYLDQGSREPYRGEPPDVLEARIAKNEKVLEAATTDAERAAAQGAIAADRRDLARAGTQPTHNYVVFNARDVNVLSRNGKELVAQWDAVSPEGIPTAKYAAGGELVPISDRVPATVLNGGDGSGGGPPPGGLGADNPIGPAGPPPEGPGWRVPGAARQPRPPIFRYDDRGAFVKFARGVLDTWRNTFQPELVSDRALTADPLFARYKSRQAAGHDIAIHRAEEVRHFWFDVSKEDRLRYMDDFEAGRFKIEVETKPDVFERVVGRGEEAWQQIAQRHSDMLEQAYKMEEEAGSPASYIQDYFPHIFEDPVKARNWVEGRTAQMGPDWFRKHRAFETIREAQEAGLRLKTTNPEDLVTLRLMASADMLERMDLLRQLHDLKKSAEDDIYGMAVPAKGLNFPLENHGWLPINAPNGEQWMIHPDIIPLWKNAVEAKGLWSREDAIGSAFRGWMSLKNVWVPLKLALSLFHPLHVLGINFAEGMVRAADQIWKPVKFGEAPDVPGAIKSAFESIYGPVQAAIPGVPHLGKSARIAWEIPEADRTPAQQRMIDLMHDGGFVPQLSQQLKIAATRSLQEAVQNRQLLGIGWHGFRFVIQELQAPIFEKWIPNLKAAAYMRDAQALLQRRPELLDDATQRRVALRAISSSIDDRFGEMFYGGLFWNRTVKDAGIGSFISMGWQTGLLRQLAGAPQGVYGLARRMTLGETPTKATIRDARNKISYIVAYTGLHSLIFGTLGYLLTTGWNKSHPDQPPDNPMPQDWMDLTLPRIGGRNPDGSPRRVTTMSYTREIPMWKKHYEEHGGGIEGALLGTRDLLANKTLYGPIRELMNNQNYYGAEIRDPNAPYYDQLKQVLKNFGGEQLPISLQGSRRAKQTGGNDWEAGMSFLGFSPAPAYASKTATQNRIQYFFDNYVAVKSRPYAQGQQAQERADIRTELLQAQQAHDKDAESEAVAKWAKAGGSMQGLTNILHGIGGDVAMFRALPIELQEQVMKEAGPAEWDRYKPWMKSNIIKDTANLMIQAQQAQNKGDDAEYRRLMDQANAGVERAAAEGHITDKRAFNRAITERMRIYHQPELGTLLTLPKKLRGRYAPQQTLPMPAQPMPVPAATP
jgi:hypothetical protein